MINIVGAGMAGSILARLLYKEGISFMLFDCLKKGRASFVSENLIGYDWYEKDRREAALNILRTIVPIRTIETNGQKYHHVYRRDLLIGGDFVTIGEAEFLKDGVYCNDKFYPGTNVDCRGIWSPNQKTKVGHGLFVSGKQVEWIRDFKPFRLLKFIEHSPSVMWFSNSMDILPKTYHNEKTKFIGELKALYGINVGEGEPEYEIGYRPHGEIKIDKHPYGYQLSGGYKSGMVTYPIMAIELLKLMKYENAI